MRRPRFDRFVVVALLLHAGAVFWLMQQRAWVASSDAPAAVEGAASAETSLAGSARRETERLEGVTELSIEVIADAPAAAVAGTAVQQRDPLARRARVEPAANAAEPTDAVEIVSVEPAAGDGLSGLVESPHVAEQGTAAPSSTQSGSKLSLQQMGIGAPNALVLAPLLQTCATPEEQKQHEFKQAEQRLATGLAQGLLDQDTQKGLSGGSWLTSVIDQAAMGVSPERGKARFSVLTDAQGLVVRIDVLESNSDMDAWLRVADRALADLASKRRSNPIARPIRTLIDVESRVSLPSGRSPGMGVSLLNIPLKNREHKDSPNIELLSLKPTLQKVEVLDPSKTGQKLELPVITLQFQLLGINGDLVDLGSVGRQVVHSHVVREDVQ